MPMYAYRLLNVFAETTLGGNPLCVFEDGRGLDTPTMQSLARQFNLSETTFILPAENPQAVASVRTFTPDREIPFAGHPTLGTAHVVRGLFEAGDRFTLEFPAGLYPVRAEGNHWQLQAPSAKTREVTAPRAALAGMAGLEESDLAERPMWVSCGMEILLLPLNSGDALERVRVDREALLKEGLSGDGLAAVYVWAPATSGLVEARMFFESNGSVIEDPATGSAAAALGGWRQAMGLPLPGAIVVDQGRFCQRPSRLFVDVTESEIRVSGCVFELGRGFIDLR